MCISASILGVEAYCYPGSTPKNQNIFEYSVKDKFPASHLVMQTAAGFRGGTSGLSSTHVSLRGARTHGFKMILMMKK